MSFNFYNLTGIDPKRYVGIVFLLIVLSIGVRIFTMLAIGEDAKGIAVKNRTLWMILGFFFPLIVAIIYAITRKSIEKNTPKMCMNCGATLPPNTKLCYNCQSPALLDYKVADAQKHFNMRKLFMVLAICFYVVNFIVSQVFGVMITRDAANMYKHYNNGSYSQEHGNQGSGDENDDAFDNFNNFGSEEQEDEEDEDDNDENDVGDETPPVPIDPFDFFDDFDDFGDFGY
ncbi:MAG: hypothetical protein K6C14_08450 [Eubacterium sp.]|nr:hypothetical protein [Eubacterium sp.]